MEGQTCRLILAMFCFLHQASSIETSGVPEENPAKEMIQVGLVFSMNSSVDKVVESCISMACSDFYDAHPDYHTRLSLLIRDPKDDVVDAASAVLDLMENEEVHAILGPKWSSQAKFVIDLGEKAQVPIISFSATSPSLSPTQSHYFVRTAYDDSSQVGALAAVVQAYGWREITLVYEDTEYGNGLVPYLVDAFQEVDARISYRSVIPLFTENIDIVKELNNLLTRQTRVFLVHMTAGIGSRFFALARDAGMMSEEFAWIVTDGLSSLLDPFISKSLDSMQGVLGVRPHVPLSESRRNFEERWRKLYAERNPHDEIADLSLFGLWAYDTVTALALAERWHGILQRLSPELNLSRREVYKASANDLKPPTWPGETLKPPKGWVMPISGKKLRIGVPKKDGFDEFFKIEWDPHTGVPSYSGFAHDMFMAVLDTLPFAIPYKYIPYMNESRQSAGTYDDMLFEI
ncbi:hypothetical protein EUGRSUZ_L00907 [Eucalyptus grandis]|uniref:Receptor ligand binding region domain-containing protein n=3 Tax=Eucalyptus grandis TaxID=71139 RepID=A0AAD9TB55_EUCGR|nr:hypothetical protein EUGRSUZ_L00907 [Eucalyptus grandis]